MFKWFRPAKPCPSWDEYNQGCMWERMEKITRFEWEELQWNNPAGSLDELD